MITVQKNRRVHQVYPGTGQLLEQAVQGRLQRKV